MKNIIIILAILAMACVKGMAQDIEYLYDDAGNRTARKIIPLAAPPPPAQQNSESTEPLQSKKDNSSGQFYEESLAGQQYKIYPNPTEGMLRVEISNFVQGQNGSIKVFDMAGRLLKNITPLKENMEIDLSTQPAGSYIMILSSGTQKKEWKIIKQ